VAKGKHLAHHNFALAPEHPFWAAINFLAAQQKITTNDKQASSKVIKVET